MAIEVNWSDNALNTFSQNVDYLEREWSPNEVEVFIITTQLTIERLKRFPESYPPGKKHKSYRKARLNKYIALFYKYNKTKKQIILLSFWNVRQNPDKLDF